MNVDNIDEEQVKNAVTAVQNLMKDSFNNKDEFCTAFEHLKVTLHPVTQILERFEKILEIDRIRTYFGIIIWKWYSCFQNMWLPRERGRYQITR